MIKYDWEKCETEGKDFNYVCRFFDHIPKANEFVLSNVKDVNCEGTDSSEYVFTGKYTVFGCCLYHTADRKAFDVAYVDIPSIFLLYS